MSNFTGNTHRAVIETSVPPGMELIAAGPQEFCQTQLAGWIAKHPLGEFSIGLVVEVTPPENSFLSAAMADPDGQQLAEAAANLAPAWGKEWGIRWEEFGHLPDWTKMFGSEEEAREKLASSAFPGLVVSRVIGPWKTER